MASNLGSGKLVTDGLIFCLDPSNIKSYVSGTTIFSDLSVTSTSGSLVNGVGFNPSNGGYFTFDGTNDYWTSNTSMSLSNHTVIAWIRPTNLNTSWIPVIEFSMGTGDFRAHYYIQGNTTGTVSARNGFGANWASSSGIENSTWSQAATATITSGSWYMFTGRVSSSFGDTFIDVNRSKDTKTPVSYTNVTTSFFGNYRSASLAINSLYPLGDYSIYLLYNRALSDLEIFQTFEATRERFGKQTTITDLDSFNFINTANISNITQQIAIDTLVNDLKNAGLWGKMKAIYPFVGGTAASHKWNLKDPRDLDAAFRLQFNGGWTHSSNGADPNGTNAWADTYLNPSTTLSAHNIGLTYYSRENTSGGTSIGADNNSSPGEYCKMRIGSGSNIGELVIGATNVGLSKFTVTNSAAYFIGSATNSTTRKIYRNGVSISFNSQETLGVNGLVNYSLPLARNGGALTYSYDDKQCAFATIGDGLTDTDAANLYTIVQKYQTTLGRQV